MPDWDFGVGVAGVVGLGDDAFFVLYGGSGDDAGVAALDYAYDFFVLAGVVDLVFGFPVLVEFGVGHQGGGLAADFPVCFVLLVVAEGGVVSPEAVGRIHLDVELLLDVGSEAFGLECHQSAALNPPVRAGAGVGAVTDGWGRQGSMMGRSRIRSSVRARPGW